MASLPNARVNSVVALQHDNSLIIYVTGLTSGFGGRLVVTRSPTDEFPPVFNIREYPGNSGINPAASPRDVPTVAAYAFESGPLESIIVVDLSGRKEISVLQVEADPGLEIDDPPQEDGAQEPAGFPRCEWSAVHDLMPPGPARLTVRGVCSMPTPGYALTLAEAASQGINPTILLLELEVTPPSGFVPQVITPAPVEFHKVTDDKLKQIQIIDGPTFDVEIVH